MFDLIDFFLHPKGPTCTRNIHSARCPRGALLTACKMIVHRTGCRDQLAVGCRAETYISSIAIWSICVKCFLGEETDETNACEDVNAIRLIWTWLTHLENYCLTWSPVGLCQKIFGSRCQQCLVSEILDSVKLVPLPSPFLGISKRPSVPT